MSGEYLEYMTLEGDRWDLIAELMYGDCWAFEGIIAANPTVPLSPVLGGGIRLRIPLRERVEVTAFALPPWKVGLPPWKR